jgi:hypothetical protein
MGANGSRPLFFGTAKEKTAPVSPSAIRKGTGRCGQPIRGGRVKYGRGRGKGFPLNLREKPFIIIDNRSEFFVE